MSYSPGDPIRRRFRTTSDGETLADPDAGAVPVVKLVHDTVTDNSVVFTVTRQSLGTWAMDGTIPLTYAVGTGIQLEYQPFTVGGVTTAPDLLDLGTLVAFGSGSGGGPSVTPLPPTADRLAGVYCTDEDVFLAGGADWGVIVPRSNLIARGTDGLFDPADPWTLASGTNAFAARGCRPRMVVKLSAPAANFQTPQCLAVETVGASSVTLRRAGMAAGVGLPPAPAAGLTGVAFEVCTLNPQIELAAYELNERYSLDPKLVNRKPADLYDQRVFRRLTCLWVLYQLYADQTRTKDGDFPGKAEHFRDEYEAALDAAVVRWGPRGDSQATTTRFSTRISR